MKAVKIGFIYHVPSGSLLVCCHYGVNKGSRLSPSAWLQFLCLRIDFTLVRAFVTLCGFFFFFFLVGGKEGNASCTLVPRAPCIGLQHGLPMGLFARWTICRLTYPLKPPYAGDPGHIPVI